MTKTLTQQWCDGTLDNGFYYVRSGWSAFIEIRYLGEGFFEGNIEVLEPVPSYTELTLMEGNYRLAKKALRDCYNEMKYWAKMNHRCSKIFNHIKAALVEIEEVK